jgi:alpha-glucosidase (family GH31 glycosyl hydrolase)
VAVIRGAGRRRGTGAATAVALALFALALVWALPEPAAAAPAADAGALRAVVRENPWRLTLVDREGRPVLSEDPSTGPGPAGTLGFRTGGTWRHATRVIDSRRRGGAYVAELATTDPLRTIRVRIDRSADGVVALDAELLGPPIAVEAMGMGFSARSNERYLGFGERSNAVDQRGSTVENYVSDGPYQTEEYPFLNAFVPPWGLRERRDATYFPIPWLLSTAGYGVLVDNPETSYYRLDAGRTGAWSVEVTRAPAGEPGGALGPPPDRLSLRFFAGPNPRGALRRFTRATGRQPRPAAPWTLGTWYQATEDEREEVELLREADAPLSVLQTYLHYLPCGEQVGVEGEQPPRTRSAHAAGVAITTYFNPMICANYRPAFAQARAAGALTETRAGAPYLYRYGASPDDTNLVGQFDFFERAGRDAYAQRLDEAIGDGYDGWMEDFGEYTPLDSVSAGRIAGTRAHNPYATRYHCGAYRAVRDRARPIVRFQRSGWTGAARCAQVVWGGDPTSSFGFDGLSSAVRQSLSIGLSGVGIWGSDIGGFFQLGSNELSPELLKRWVQFGAVSAVMRTQANGVALPPKERPQVIDPDQIENWRRYTKLHTQLYPYLVAAQARYERSGVPLMRHLALGYPNDRRATAQETEFMFGPDLLAAPVVRQGARERDVYLPKGRWIDVWRSVRYSERSGGLRLGEPRTLTGRRTVQLPAPLEELPLLARAGAVLPLLPPSVDTLSGYAERRDDLVSLADRRDRLRLLAFPRGRSAADFNRRGEIVSRERRRSWTLRVEAPRRLRYRLQASLETLRHPFAPCQVRVDGRRLPDDRWSYRRASGALRVAFAGRSVRLVARGRCGG